MSGSTDRNPSSQPPNNNKEGRKDVFNMNVGGQKVDIYNPQSFSTFTSQDGSDYTEVLSKKNARKQQKQQQQQTPKQHTMTTRSSSTGPQVVIEQRGYDKSAYHQAASSVSSRRPKGGPQFQSIPPNESGNEQQDETSMDIDNNKDNQQSTKQPSKDKQVPNPLLEDLDDQQNGKLSFRARAPFNKILGNNRIVKMKFLKNQLYKDYDIVKITTIYQKKDKENLFQIEFDNQEQYNKFVNTEFSFMENDEPVKFQIKDDAVLRIPEFLGYPLL